MLATELTLDLERAQHTLTQHRCVAIPTETVYGLAANACSDSAVQDIYRIKQRPSTNPLIIHVSDLSMAQQWGIFNTTACLLAQRFWHETPASLTLVVPLKYPTSLSQHVTAGQSSIAIRVPHHPLTRDLIARCQFPLAAPSANRSRYISPTDAQSVCDELYGEIEWVIDGGTCQLGIESTIIDVRTETPRILRAGPVLTEDLDRCIAQSTIPQQPPSEQISLRMPGMCQRHYAPHTPVILNAHKAADGGCFLGFGPIDCDANLSRSACLEEAARNLYRMLRQLDQQNFKSIAVAPIPHHGIGIALNDRLKRAASAA